MRRTREQSRAHENKMVVAGVREVLKRAEGGDKGNKRVGKNEGATSKIFKCKILSIFS